MTLPHAPPLRRLHRHREHAFTLIELMIVVVILGVLAAIAVPSFGSYVQRARMAESVTFLGEIKQRQEAYRAEFGQFANVSTDLTDYTPATMPAGGTLVAWPAENTIPNWVQLGARPDASVRFQYGVIAGFPGGAAAAPAVYNLPANDFWFVAQANGDMDGDGDTVQVEALSHRQGVWISEPKGWE